MRRNDRYKETEILEKLRSKLVEKISREGYIIKQWRLAYRHYEVVTYAIWSLDFQFEAKTAQQNY